MQSMGRARAALTGIALMTAALAGCGSSLPGMGGPGGKAGAAGAGGKATGSGGAAAGSGGQAAGGAGGVGGKATGSGGAAAGSGGQAAGGAGVVHSLPGATQVDVPPWPQCVTINTVPQTLPQSVVSFNLIDGGGASPNSYRVAIVPSSYTCGPDPLDESLPPYLSVAFTGSGSYSAQVPAADYSLDVICESTVNDCLITSITWSATY